MSRKSNSYIKSRNLVNRVYDMLEYFKFKSESQEIDLKFKQYLNEKLKDIYFVETLIKYLDDKLKRNYKKVELRCNLYDLIYDLDYLKQYLDNWFAIFKILR